jgi:hypothetical protein
MVPARFFDELKRLPPFAREGAFDPKIAKAPLPPKQAFLPGLFLFGHARGYRLPTWESFREYYLRAIRQHKSYASKFALNFGANGEPEPGLLWRMSGWYEDSMAHAFLYSVLVLAYEDLDQSAFILYDARVDWKFKADFIVMRHSGADIKAVRVNIYGQTDDDRAKVEIERDDQERQMKVNTPISAHWRNETYRHLPVANISKATGGVIVRQNFHLFSPEALEQLMNDVDDALARKRKKIGIHDLLTYRAH